MANGFLISGWLLRVLDANGSPPGSAFPFQVAFFDASTQTPATVYNDAECSIPLGTVVSLNAYGYAPDGGVWGEMGKAYKAVVSRVLSSDTELPDSERLETLYTLNGISCGPSGGSTSGAGVSVPSMAALRLLTPTEYGAVFFLAGYYSANDGGQGLFRWESGSYETDDGGYSVRPDSVSSGEAGRFIRVMAGELDVRWWGAIPDGVVDCVSPLSRCKAHAARIDLYAAPPRIVFAPGKAAYNLPGNVVLGGADGRGLPHVWRIQDGVKFTGFTSMSIATQAIIEATGALDDGFVKTSLVIYPGVVSRVDLRWWGPTCDDLYDVMGFYAPGVPVYLDKTIGDQGILSFANSPASVYPGRIIIGDRLMLHAGPSEEIKFDSFEYEGQARQLFSRADSSGGFSFRDMESVNAWAYGWGSGDDSGGIEHALYSATKSSAVLYLNGNGVNGFSTPVLSSVVVSNQVQVHIVGTLSVGSNGSLWVMDILNGPSKVISYDAASVPSPVRIYSGQVNAAWFGSGGTAISSAVSAASYGPIMGRVVDLCGKTYSIISTDSEIVCDVDGMTLSNGTITCNAAISAAVHVISSDVVLKNISITGYANTTALLSVSAESAHDDVTIHGCSFSCGSYGYGAVVGSGSGKTSRVRFVDCVFKSRASGSLPFLTGQMAEDVRFSGCDFTKLYRSSWNLYGSDIAFSGCKWSTASTAASLLAWKGISGFRFVDNDCTMFGLELHTTSEVVVERNSFRGQGVILLKCQSNGQVFNGVSVVGNRFVLDSISEWASPIHVGQEYTTDAGGYITAVTKAFDWTPTSANVRIAENASNMGAYMHQTEVSGRFYGGEGLYYLHGLIPLAPIIHSHFSSALALASLKRALEIYSPALANGQVNLDTTINCFVVKHFTIANGGFLPVWANKGFSWSISHTIGETCMNKTINSLP